MPSIELALLGIPGGFTPAEIQSWLRDLAGVAVETSRTDERSRPIPQLLHHALTGLLFSQTELWSHTGQPLPCAAVFVHGPQGVAFGWVGRARVVLLVNGEPHEPQWVIVRDEAGQEAMSAALPAEAHVLLTLEYWPNGEDNSPAPASLDAEWGQSFANLVSTTPAIPQPAPQPAVVVPAEPQPRRATRPAGVAPKTESVLPTEQPGLAPDPGVPLDEPDAAQKLPSTRHPSSGTFAMPQVPGLAAPPSPTTETETPSAEPPAEPATQEDPKHPVGRWLSRVIGFAKRAVTRTEPGASPEPEPSSLAMSSAPVSEPPRVEPAPMLTSIEPVLEERPATAPAPPIAKAPDRAPVPAPIAREPVSPPPARPIATPRAPVAAPPAATTRPPQPAAPPLTLRPAGEAPRVGLAPAGIEEILGRKRAPVAPAGPVGRLEGLTATGIPSHPVSPEASRPAYPALDVTPVGPPARAPMQIEREPIGADTTFAIPRLPSLSTPRPAKVVVPTAADMMRRDAEVAARRASPPPAVPPHAAEPEPIVPHVPEPPTEFLAEFAASAEPVVDPMPGKVVEMPPASAIETASVVVTPSPAAEPPQHAPEAPVVPRGVSVVMGRPNLPSVHRAAAITSPTSAPVPESAPATPVLRTPSVAEPVPVAESEVPTLMRELPLPATEPEPAEGEVPEGVLIATRSTTPPRRFRRNDWPEMEGTAPPSNRWRNPTVIGIVVALLFGVGWIVGHAQAPDNDIHSTPMSRMLRSIGLGGARFTTTIETDPPGAFIAVDGQPIARRTPSTIDLVPGTYKLTLSLPDLGEVVVPLTGKARQKLKVSEALHGSLDVTALDPSVPVKMSLDGEPKGFLPVRVESLPPGLHEVQFSGPNMQPWGQTVNIGIRQNSALKARPMMSPATGVLAIQASLNDESGTAPLQGASVYVDGELRGQTPLTLELPRGPHSLRLTFRGETAPIQVIDLPGGNKRFASFQFGLDSDLPPLRLNASYATLSARKPTLVEASLAGLDWRDLREAWLHVRTGDGLWRRYQMTIGEGPKGALLSAEFPTNLFDANGRVIWYMSAATSQGDEFHTEMQRSSR